MIVWYSAWEMRLMLTRRYHILLIVVRFMVCLGAGGGGECCRMRARFVTVIALIASIAGKQGACARFVLVQASM